MFFPSKHTGLLAVMLYCLAVNLPGNAEETVLSFSGAGSYIDLGTPTALQIPSNDPFTIEGWMYFHALSTRDLILSKNNGRSGPAYTYLLGFADNKMSAYDGALWVGQFSVTRETGRWYHIAFSFDGTTMFFYIDGALIGSVAFSFTNTEAHTIKFGGYSGTHGDIDGMMSDIRIWNHARSQAEIQQNMNRRLFGDETGLLGYWNMIDGEGDIVTDSTLNESDGNIINGSWIVDGSLYLENFLASDPVTRSTRFTNTNKLDVVRFPGLPGYNEYQITEGGALPVDEAWISTNTLPDTVEFTMPGSDTEVLLTAWLTNAPPGSVELDNFKTKILFTTASPVPAVKATHSRGKAPAQDVVVYPWEIDDGSTGGTTGGEEIPVHSLYLRVESGPDADATPEEPFITVSATGTYHVTLTVTNTAGNTAVSTECALTVEEIESNTFVWEGNASSDWFEPLNWDLQAVPFDGTEVIINEGADVVLSAPSAELASFEMNGGTLTFTNWTTTLSAGEIIISTGLVTCAGPFTNNVMSNRVWFTCSDFTLGKDALIDVNKKGYARGGNGPGGGQDTYHGAAHGGYSTTLMPYGDAETPIYPGSGGFGVSAGDGGGAVLIEADSDVVVEGIITANGGNYSANHNGGGSGGSVFITCDRFFASNTVLSAIGGNGLNVGRGGGGGRIAVRYNSTAQNSDFVDNVQFLTTPGSGSGVADIGTIYFPDNKLMTSYMTEFVGQIWGFSSWSPENLIVDGARVRFAESGFSPTISNNLLVTGASSMLEIGGTQVKLLSAPLYFGTDEAPHLFVGNNLSVSNGGTIHIYSGITNAGHLHGAHVTVQGDTLIMENSTIFAHSDPTNGGSAFFHLKNLTIEEGGAFSVDNSGFAWGYGPGAGTSSRGAGGYGGYGGFYPTYGGETYGSAEQPDLPGSGSGGTTSSHGAGGGLLRIRASGTIRIDGSVTAVGGNGTGNHTSGGSGGAIFIECHTFLGGGPAALISVKGGNGLSNVDYTSAGGGGRIAIWTGDLYTETTPPHRISSSETPPSSYEGAINIAGGTGGGRDGDPGTVLFVHVLFPAGTFFTSF